MSDFHPQPAPAPFGGDDSGGNGRRGNRLIIAACAVGVVGLLLLAGVVLLGLGSTGRHTTTTADRLAPPPASASVGFAAVTPPPSSAPPSASASATPSKSARPSPAKTTTKPAAPGNASFEDQVVSLVNQERAKAGCAALTVDSRLAAAAREHSQDMATRNYFDHTTPEGVDPGTRITNAGYRWQAYGENIAMGQPDPDSVMQAWMNSPGHRANILNCNFKNLGVGLAYNAKHQPYWTQDFGRLL